MKNESCPLVTIIVPVYNREDLIRETLDSALNQDFDNYEVVIVDNQSSDKTYEILKEYAKKDERIKIFQNKENLGPVRNWKVGIDKSKGKYLKILWSDDQISQDFLKKTVPILETNGDIGFVYTTTKVYNKRRGVNLYRFGKTGKYKIEDFVKAHLLGTKSVPVSPGNSLFRLDDVKKNLLINLDNPKNLDFSRYGAGNDLLIFLLTVNDYSNFYFIDEVLSFFRAHKASFSLNTNLSEYYLFSKVYFTEKCLNQLDSKIVNKFQTKVKINPKYRYMVDGMKMRYDFRFILDYSYFLLLKKVFHRLMLG